MDDNLLTTDTAALDEVPLERLETEIAGFASRLAAATARWLLWIAAYDRREGWASWEAKSCVHWLNWQCGVSPRTAREHVRVAHTLVEFDQLRDMFVAGQLSYSKVRAISRVITVDNEVDILHIARNGTASQLERILGKLPRPGSPDERNIDECTFTNNGDGTMTMTLTRPVEEMSHVRASINKSVSEVIDRENTKGQTRTETIENLGGMKTLKASTAAALVTGTLNQQRGVESTVLVVADIDALTGADPLSESTVDSERVDAAVVQRLCCDGKIQAALLDANGCEQAIGAETRIVPRRIRRLLERRDHGMCQFPGCESEHRLHAHHVIHWANGGPTELGNLILLCHFHHHSVHEGGWNITGTGDGWQFTDPAGLPHFVSLLRLPTKAPLPATASQTTRGSAGPLATSGERANIHYAADVIATNAHVRQRRSKDRSPTPIRDRTATT